MSTDFNIFTKMGRLMDDYIYIALFLPVVWFSFDINGFYWVMQDAKTLEEFAAGIIPLSIAAVSSVGLAIYQSETVWEALKCSYVYLIVGAFLVFYWYVFVWHLHRIPYELALLWAFARKADEIPL